MTFAHILCDKDVTIDLTEINKLNETLFQMDKETYYGIVSISEDFENSLENSLENERQKLQKKKI